MLAKYRLTYDTIKEQIAAGGDKSLFEQEFGFNVDDFLNNFEDAEELIEGLTNGTLSLINANNDLGISFQDNTTNIKEAANALSAYSEKMKAAKGTIAEGYTSVYDDPRDHSLRFQHVRVGEIRDNQ